MSLFKKELAERNTKLHGRRRWIFVPYDQLSDKLGPLSREAAETLGIVLVENPWKVARRPYHKQKLAVILANLRHFALEQAGRGVAIRHVVADGPYRDALGPLINELGPINVMEPAERELRDDLQPLAASGGLKILHHEGWLTDETQFQTSVREPPWRMDAFYRGIRRKTGILMDKDKPVGGRFSFDAENRKPWRGEPPAPKLPVFPRDPIKEEVGRLIMTVFAHHPGRLDLDALPATLNDAETLWSWAKIHCLYDFGRYQDAMSGQSTNLFHTRISSLMNIHRLLPARIIEDVLKIDLPMSGKEGFIRQVLGWREFVRHVHRSTDGFRILPFGSPPVVEFPGDGGYSKWSGHHWLSKNTPQDPDGGAAPSFLTAENPLPPVFWGAKSGLTCLDRVVEEVWAYGYSHHITRLMILSNMATLLDVRPREITDWFWVAYTDAFDWVVEPNVLGMGTYALGDLMTTKPYVSGAAYIHRMSDYCKACSFDPKTDCPFTNLYWAFLDRHKAALETNARMRTPLASLQKREAGKKRRDRSVFKIVLDRLNKGDELQPKHLSEPSL